MQKIQLGLNDPNQDFINREKNSDVEEFKQHFYALSAKLHYTDTGYGHVVQRHQQTPPTDELTTILQIVVQQICHIAMPEPNISTCQDVGMWQSFLRWW